LYDGILNAVNAETSIEYAAMTHYQCGQLEIW